MRKTVSILILILLVSALLIPAAAFAGINSLTLSSYLTGAVPEYRIQYSVGSESLYQANNDYISVVFSEQAELPDQISTADVLVNTVRAREVKVDRNQGRIDIVLPMDLMVNQSVDILIKPGARIKNPSTPGRYAIGVTTSKSLSMSQHLYSVVSGMVSTPVVEVVPASPSEPADYTISFDVSADGGLTGGTDTISITFPQDITLPYTIGRNAITVNGRALDSDHLITISGKKVTLTVPYGASVQPGGRVTVKVRPEARIHNPVQAGAYRLFVATSRDTIPVASEVYYISGSAVMNLSVDVSPVTVNIPALYEISFMTSKSGALHGGRDVITITFPYETGFPNNVARSSVEFQGEALSSGYVSVSHRTLSFTVPPGFDVGPGKWVIIKIKAGANITTPREAGNYQLKVNTSKDQIPVTSNVYKIFEKKVINLVVDSKTAFIDGKPVSLDVPATILNGRTLVPIRFVAESLGARVGWDGNTREVTVSLDGKTVKLTIDSRIALVNGKQEILDTTPVIRDGRTLVPIRFIAENLGGEVYWDNETRTVIIRK